MSDSRYKLVVKAPRQPAQGWLWQVMDGELGIARGRGASEAHAQQIGMAALAGYRAGERQEKVAAFSRWARELGPVARDFHRALCCPWEHAVHLALAQANLLPLTKVPGDGRGRVWADRRGARDKQVYVASVSDGYGVQMLLSMVDSPDRETKGDVVLTSNPTDAMETT